jgi:circadian clock protein KaiC
MLTRIIDFLKTSGRTTLCSSLSETGPEILMEEVAVSSLMDTWLVLRNETRNGRRTRTVTIIKSRGMAHATDVREFELTDDGVVIGGDGNGGRQELGGA